MPLYSILLALGNPTVNWIRQVLFFGSEAALQVLYFGKLGSINKYLDKAVFLQTRMIASIKAKLIKSDK